jgi:membrane associated rhomboid family serine protease
MLWELALFSILVPTGYWGATYVRRKPYGSSTFGWMLVATAALALIALIGRSSHAGWANLIGAIAVGAGVVQLIVGPLLRAAARWAVGNDRLRLAAVIVDVRDVLQPGMGGRDDKRMVAALRDVKEGRVDAAVAALESLRERAPASARNAIDERIVLLYLSAQRWQDALGWADRTLLAASAPRAADDALPADARVEAAARALGVSPSVFIELVTARLRVGDLDGAADLADRFDAAAAGVPELALLVFRLHLVFLAHVGRVTEVDRLLDPRLASYVTPAARRYWAGVARKSSGDVPGARAAFTDARGLAGRDRRARALIEEGLAEVDVPAPAPTPRALEVADRMARTPVAVPPRAPSRRAGVTTALVLGNLAVAAVCTFLLGGPGDLGSIIRAGANVRSAVATGEEWRLASSVFVHVGAVHLIVNVLALWSLGRLVEGLYGRARMLAIYGAAGIIGAIASHVAARAGVSAGASGAIFGLLGAALVELALHRGRYRREWRRSLLGALVVVTVAQLAVGLYWPMIDQWAHVGGLLGGALVGALLSPGWRLSEHPAVTWSARAFAAVIVFCFAYAAVMAAITDYGDSLERAPRVERSVGDFTIDAPAAWVIEGEEIGDPDANVVFQVIGGSIDLARWEEEARNVGVARGFTEITRARSRVAVPAGWESSEWILSARDPLGSTQRFRMVTFVGEVGGRPLAGLLHAPDVLTWSGAGELGAILATVR